MRGKGQSWEPDKSRYDGCSAGFVLVWAFMAVCCPLTLLCVRGEWGQAGGGGAPQPRACTRTGWDVTAAL